MNITNYEIENRVTNNTLNIIQSEDVKYDKLAQKIFRLDCPYFAAPVSEVSINGETIFRYDLGNYTSIEKINMKMSGSEFIKLLKNLIIPLTDCCDWMLDSHYFVLQPQLVFVNTFDYSIRYIYSFDLDNRSDDSEITAFFSDIIKNVRITDSTNLNNMLLRMVVDNNVSVTSLLDLVKRFGETPESAKYSPEHNSEVSIKKPAPVPVQATVQPAAEAPKKSESKTEVKFPKIPVPIPQKAEKKEEKQSAPVDLLSSERNEAMEKLFGSGKSKKQADKKPKTKEKKNVSSEKGKESILSFLKKDKPAAKNNVQAVSAVQPSFESEETVFAAFDEPTEIQTGSPYFLLKENNGPLNAPQRVDLVFDRYGEMFIGRQSENSDYVGYKFSAEFKKISRKHARITRSGDSYLITDLGSANKTVMNGQTLKPNEAYTLEDGALLIFGDSLYIYEFRIM